jgi:UDP-N-acetyl-D-mannosaminuronate dehydrogenase
LLLAEDLAKRGFKLLLHDPMVDPSSITTMYDKYNARFCNSLEECLKEGTFFILATPHNEYKRLLPEDFADGTTILDCWRCMDHNFEGNKRVKYIKWGISSMFPVKPTST